MPSPLGLLAYSDPVADRQCQWAMESGIRVPEALALRGIGNDRFVCESAQVPISSVVYGSEAYAEAAVETLAWVMAGEALEQTTIRVSPAGIVTR